MEDQSGQFDAVVFDNVYELLKAPVQADQILVVEGELSYDNFNGGTRMLVNQIFQLDEARVHLGKHLSLTLTPESSGLMDKIEFILKAHQGQCPVKIHYQNADARVVLNVGQSWRVKPTDELLKTLSEILGEDKACFV